jgi:hypothetical protein
MVEVESAQFQCRMAKIDRSPANLKFSYDLLLIKTDYIQYLLSMKVLTYINTTLENHLFVLLFLKNNYDKTLPIAHQGDQHEARTHRRRRPR